MRLLFATIIAMMTTLLCELPSSARYFTSYDKSGTDFYSAARCWTYDVSIRYMSVFSPMRVPRRVVLRRALLTAIFLMFIFSLSLVAREVT